MFGGIEIVLSTEEDDADSSLAIRARTQRAGPVQRVTKGRLRNGQSEASQNAVPGIVRVADNTIGRGRRTPAFQSVR